MYKCKCMFNWSVEDMELRVAEKIIADFTFRKEALHKHPIIFVRQNDANM